MVTTVRLGEGDLMEVYKQPFTRRKWSVTKPSKAMQILYKITLGRFGDIPMVELEERKMYLYCTGAPQERLPMFHEVESLPSHVNFRCSFIADD